MVENPKTGKTYYMIWSDTSKGAGFYKVEIGEHLPEPNKGFYSMKVVDIYYTDTKEPVLKDGLTNIANLHDTFKKALIRFKKETDYDEQDMIVGVFWPGKAAAEIRSKFKQKVAI